MTQVYQGIDLVGISKFMKILERHRDFVSEIFTEQERAYCFSKKNPSVHLAGRFAAKESTLKALGRGIAGPGIDHIFQEIEIGAEASGKPRLVVSGWAARLLEKRKIRQVSVSISHAADYAVASVIMLGDG